MMDRRQILVGSAAALVAVHLPLVAPAVVLHPHFASTWWWERIYDLGDKLGWMSGWSDVRQSLLHTVVVTEIEAVEIGAWNFGLDTVGKPDVLIYPDPAPPDSYNYEAMKRLWHLSRLSPKRTRSL
jgi:hypothetical protein